MDSLDYSVLSVWLFSLVIGVLIGIAKGQEVSGALWPLFFGPIGVLVVLCLPNLKARKEKDQFLALQRQQIQIQQQQLEEMRRIQGITVSEPVAIQPQIVQTPTVIRLAKGGEEIEPMAYGILRMRIERGLPIDAELYFDDAQNDWLPISQLE